MCQVKEKEEAELPAARSGGVYDFLTQDDQEVEIKIEPIQNVLKFSNLDAINTAEYQNAI